MTAPSIGTVDEFTFAVASVGLLEGKPSSPLLATAFWRHDVRVSAQHFCSTSAALNAVGSGRMRYGLVWQCSDLIEFSG